MSNLSPRIERLKAMLGLEEKRIALHRQLELLNQQLSALKDRLFDDTLGAPAKTTTPAKISRKGRSRRGALKDQVLTALSSAGPAGIRVTELAAALGTKAANIHAWFHSTGKRIPSIAKVSGGHYKLKAGTEMTTGTKPTTSAKSTRAAKPAAPKTKSGKKKGKGAKRGELSTNILSALETAGAKGLTIKELSGKIGAKYRNISVWFVTTGKKYPKLKKVAPGHYKLGA